ncbi:MAG TPA: gliding motility-associated ABC transporter permease subunit GldF, partial [Aequorivita sp.]|nr:gliding motility-associated ABC transporter permease subunit GldF [Aequorivita sp.]
YGFEGFTSSAVDISTLGMKAHFDSVARGVLDTRDLIYFLSVTVFFIALTIFKLKKQ